MAGLIRMATPNDSADLARVQIASFRAIYSGLMNPTVLRALDLQDLARVWRARVVDGPATTLVAVEDGKVAGYASLGPARDADATGLGELWALYVAPEAWGTGVGAKLLAAASDELGRRGHTTMILWVLEANRRARAFYERHGFELDGGHKEPVEAGWMLPHLRYRRGVRVDSPATPSTR